MIDLILITGGIYLVSKKLKKTTNKKNSNLIEKVEKDINLWVEYDSYGNYISGKSSTAKNYKELISLLKSVEDKPECFSEIPELQISIMITDYNLELKNAAKVFYTVEEAIRYCEEKIVA